MFKLSFTACDRITVIHDIGHMYHCFTSRFHITFPISTQDQEERKKSSSTSYILINKGTFALIYVGSLETKMILEVGMIVLFFLTFEIPWYFFRHQ